MKRNMKKNEKNENITREQANKNIRQKVNSVDVVVEDILSDKEYNRLRDVAERGDDSKVNSMLIGTMGICGLRIAEVAHMKKDWINSDEKTINIPSHEKCPCSYCNKQYIGRLKSQGVSKDKLKDIPDHEVESIYWTPKSVKGVRSVYYGYDRRFEQLLSDFFEDHESLGLSVNAAERRVKKLLKAAGLGNHVPHDLRKTTATRFARHGLTAFELMTVMGWSDIEVAKAYIRLSGRDGYMKQKEKLGDSGTTIHMYDTRLVFFLTEFGRKIGARRKKPDDRNRLINLLFGDGQNVKVKHMTLQDYLD
jgi:integrase